MSHATLGETVAGPPGIQLNIQALSSTFPLTSFPFNILIDSEQMTVTGLSYPSDLTFWNVIRGVNGTSPAAHAFGAAITDPPTPAPGGGGDTVALLAESGGSLLLESGQPLALEVVVPTGGGGSGGGGSGGGGSGSGPGGGTAGGPGVSLLLESGAELLLENGQDLLLEYGTIPGGGGSGGGPPSTGGPPTGTVGGGGIGTGGPPTVSQTKRLLAGRVQISRRLEIYEADQSTLWMPSSACPIEMNAGGSVSVDITRDERRTLDINFVPTDSRLRIGVGQLWYDKIIRAYYGFYYGNSQLFEVPIGDFMIDRVEDSHVPSTIHVTGRDLTKRLITSQYANTVTFTAGTDVGVIVQAVAADAGITNVSVPWAAGTAPRLAFDQTFQADSTRLASLQTILNALGYEIFFTAQSTLLVRPFQDPTTFAPVWTFKGGDPDGSLVAGDSPPVRSTNDSSLYNHIVVRGSGQSNSLVFAEALVTDPSSPVYVGDATSGLGDGSNPGIGDRTWSFLSSLVASDQEAATLAAAYLKVMALESYEIDFTSIVVPWLDGGDVVSYVDPDPELGQPTNYLLSSFEIPMGIDPMTGVMKRVVSVV